jgi:RNA recognition motif-containing protein
MATKRIYVGNLPVSTRDDELRQLFSAHGEVKNANVIMDRETGRSRGFGFVEMPDEAADQAVAALNGKEWNGRNLKVNEARPREGGNDRGPRGGGGRGGDRW